MKPVYFIFRCIHRQEWEEEHPRKSLQVKRWLIRPEMLDLLQQQFEVHLESPFSGMLAEGIDVLSSLLSAADAHK